MIGAKYLRFLTFQFTISGNETRPSGNSVPSRRTAVREAGISRHDGDQQLRPLPETTRTLRPYGTGGRSIVHQHCTVHLSYFGQQIYIFFQCGSEDENLRQFVLEFVLATN